MTDFQKEIAELIIDTLRLEDTKVEDIDPQAQLFYNGLGLDSIDALELSMAVSKKYGFKMRSDNKDNEEIFSSLTNFAAHIEANKA